MKQQFKYTLLAACTLAAGMQCHAGVPIHGTPISGYARIDTPAKFRGTSNSMHRIGERNPLLPPFCEIFDDLPKGEEHDTFTNQFEIIDANNDGRSWWLYNYSDGVEYSKCAYLLYPIDTPAADDWLIPRAIRLEEGKYYYVNMDASLYTVGGDHTFEVWLGHYNDVEGMEYLVIPTVHVDSRRNKHVGGWFRAPEDGLYYMGIHGTTLRANVMSGYLFIDNIAIDEAKNGGEPSEITDIEFTNDPSSAAAVTIGFKAPSKSIDGADLSGTVNVSIFRNGTKLDQLNNIKPGETRSFTDAKVPAYGNYTYSFVAANSVGSGSGVQQTHYVGISTPVSPVIKSFTDLGQGKVELKWQAPETDVNGCSINPDIVSYKIYDLSSGSKTLVASTKQTSHTIDLHLAPGEQIALNLILTAEIHGDESTPVSTDILFVGDPYTLPYEYSFVENGTEDFVLAVDGDPEVSWRMLDDFSDPQSQDGDGGYLCMIGNAPNLTGEVSTGKISLPAERDAFVSFYTYVYPQDENTIELIVMDAETKERTTIGGFILTEFPRVGWNRLDFPLSNFAGKTVHIIIKGTIITYGYIPLDNMKVRLLDNIDLVAELRDFTPYAEAGEEYQVQARVINMGCSDVDKYQVCLVCDGRTVATANGSLLKSFQSEDFTLSACFSAADSPMPTFTVEVINDGEENPEDNVTAPFNITFIAPEHPVAKYLELSDDKDNNKLLLSWKAPDLSKAAPMPQTEDFESYEAFTTKLNDGWTMIDRDKGYVVGLQQIEMPVDFTQQAWWTMTCEGEFEFVRTRGYVSLAQMASIDADQRPIASDDWLVSPVLYGGPQTVKFYALSLNDSYGNDTFEVYYSTSGNTFEDMMPIMHSTVVPTEWTPYFVSLPDGARHFAIRCTSDNCYMMLLDDITFITPGQPRELTLLGYNVYRNHIKLNDSLLSATEYNVERGNDSDIYYVTAVYEQGESAASNIVSISTTGIADVVSDNTEAEYFDLRGIKIKADGNLSPGIYICRRGNTVDKIVIR